MSDPVVSAASSQAAPTNATSAASSPASPGNPNQQFTQEFEAFKTEISGKLNSAYAEIRRLKEAQPQPATPLTPVVAKPDDKSETRELRARLDKSEARLAKGLRENAIGAAIQKHRLTPEAVEILRDHIDVRYGGSIKTDLDSGAVYQEGDEFDEGRRDIGALVEEVMKTKGKMFLPPVSTPRGPRGTTASPSSRIPYHELPAEQRDAMTPAQRNAYVNAELGST